MLDTNTASYLVKGNHPNVRHSLIRSAGTHTITISAVTRGELMYGLALKGSPKGLSARVHAVLDQLDVLPWDTTVADTYGVIRAWCKKHGVGIAALDLMIATHAIAINATLITHDQSFSLLAVSLIKNTPFRLQLRDWTEDPPSKV
jgi:tRNA(fMet)-specific endonuclease VapC